MRYARFAALGLLLLILSARACSTLAANYATGKVMKVQTFRSITRVSSKQEYRARILFKTLIGTKAEILSSGPDNGTIIYMGRGNFTLKNKAENNGIIVNGIRKLSREGIKEAIHRNLKEGFDGYSSKRIGITEIAGRKCAVYKTYESRSSGSSYFSNTAYIDQKSYFPMKMKVQIDNIVDLITYEHEKVDINGQIDVYEFDFPLEKDLVSYDAIDLEAVEFQDDISGVLGAEDYRVKEVTGREHTLRYYENYPFFLLEIRNNEGDDVFPPSLGNSIELFEQKVNISVFFSYVVFEFNTSNGRTALLGNIPSKVLIKYLKEKLEGS